MEAAAVGLSARAPSSDARDLRHFEGADTPGTPFSPPFLEETGDEWIPRSSARFRDIELPCDHDTFERAMSETVDVYIG